MDWYKIINNKDYSEKKALEILTSLSYPKDNAPPFPQLAVNSSVPSLYGKHMMKKYFKHRDRPDIQSEALDLGIEVTRLVDEKSTISMKTIEEADRRTSSITAFENEIKKIDKKGIFTADITNVGNGRLINFDTSNIEKIINNKISEKVKLLSDYEKYDECWLFMFSLMSIDKNKLLDAIVSIEGHEKFSAYIFVSATNNGELWLIREPYEYIEKRISLGVGGICNE